MSRLHFAQGARRGHEDAKGRADQYRIGEEMMVSWSASEALGHAQAAKEALHWQWGYQHGYRLAAEGDGLEPQYRFAPEPETP